MIKYLLDVFSKNLFLAEVSQGRPLTKQQLLFPDNEFRCYTNAKANKVSDNDQAFHTWYRFVLSFPPHLVQEYIGRFGLTPQQTILDPFCGTGTTLVEAKHQHLRGIGIEANKMAHFACQVKCDWDIDIETFLADGKIIEETAKKRIRRSSRQRTFSSEQFELILKDSIEPLPLHRTLILKDTIEEYGSKYQRHQLLALATSTVAYCSKLRFGPEVGVSQKKKTNPDAVGCWMSVINQMTADLYEFHRNKSSKCYPATVHFGDSRNTQQFLKKKSIDAVFTSPPYPNEKDYTRTTRLESVLLGFLNTKAELREMKEGLLRSNTRNVYKGDNDDEWIAYNTEVLKIAEEVEKKRIAMGKTSGFEKQYHRVVRLWGIPYPGRRFACPGLGRITLSGRRSRALRLVHAPFCQTLLGDIAEHLGYKLESIDLFRTRFATATPKKMNEEVVVLRWEGK